MARSKNEASRSNLAIWLSLTGAIVILACFFLPWLEVSGSGKKIIGSGFTFAQQAAPLWLIPAIAMLILLLFVWQRSGLPLSLFKGLLLILAGLGIAMLVVTYISVEQKLGGFFVKRITSHQIKTGLIGTAVGFVLVFLSAIWARKSRRD